MSFPIRPFTCRGPPSEEWDNDQIITRDEMLTSVSFLQVKTYELREKTKGDLTKQLDELKQELSSLRVQKVAGGAPAKLAKM